jgi:replicative DNA helicase
MGDLGCEQIVLGLMMSSPRHVEDAVDRLIGADFYAAKHETIWAAIVALWAGGNPTGPEAVNAHLAETGELLAVGGAPYLHTIIAKVPLTAGTLGYHANVIRDWARRRRIHETGIRITRTAANLGVDVDDVAEAAQRDIHEATVRRVTATVRVADYVDGEFTHLEDIRDGKVEPGISTGFGELDALLGGWHPGRMVIPAGRPGMGKTLLALCWALHCARRGHPVLLFPMEMTKRELMWRFWANIAEVNTNNFQRAQFTADEWRRLAAAREEIRELPIGVDDRANTVAQIVANSRRFAQRHGRPGLIIPDYVQRLSLPGKDRHDLEVGRAAQTFKELAKELETTLIPVCQINRGNEARADKIPQLSDLRDSGQLEQEADQVVLIYRPDYYDRESERAGEADLIIAKNRHGAQDTVHVAAQLHYARFVDMGLPDGAYR